MIMQFNCSTSRIYSCIMSTEGKSSKEQLDRLPDIYAEDLGIHTAATEKVRRIR